MRSLLYIVYLPVSSTHYYFISRAEIFAKVKLRLQAHACFLFPLVLKAIKSKLYVVISQQAEICMATVFILSELQQ